MRLVKLLLVLVAVNAIYGVLTQLPPSIHLPWQRSGAQSTSQRDFPVPVTLAAASTADVPVYVTGVGTVKALNAVTVRPQIDGKITEMTFTEGAEVKKGDVLVKLDPVTVQAQLDQAAAKRSLDEALLANSLRDLERDNKVGTLGVTQQVIDTQKALVAQQSAQLKSDQAAIDNAKAQLDYATVTAPIGGITGIRMVDIGNIVRNQTDPIVVIAQVQPIDVVFTLPQQQLSEVNSGLTAGALTADALTTDGGKILDSGKLRVIDNQVDPATGTVKFKAEFPNANRQLWPGQYVSVRLRIKTLKDAIVAPTASIQQGPQGSFVYVANEDRTVTVRLVTTSQAAGDGTVITAGLTSGERVVTTGFSRLKDGARISTGQGKGGRPAGLPGAAPEAGVAAPQSPSADSTTGSAIAEPAAAAESQGQGADAAGQQPGKRRHHKNGAGGTSADAASGATGTTQ